MVPMNRSYGIWGQQQQFQNPNLNSGAMKPPASAFNKPLGPRSNWKGKRVNNPAGGGGGSGGGGGNPNLRNYNPPTLNELQDQNRLKARKFFPKRKFNKNKSMNMNMNNMGGRSAPFAPRNTTSFLIRAKKSGGIAPLVSPYPVTPSVLPTPILSPSTEVLGEMAKEEWGVDGYGSMKGLIRLRSHGHEMELNEDEEEDESSDVEVERRLDHDLSRFEMIYDPNSVNAGGMDYQNLLESRVDDQDTHIAQLEEENLILKERLFLIEREFEDLRRRLLSLERRGRREDEDANEEVIENESENESHSHFAEGFEERKSQNEDEGMNMAEDNRNEKAGIEESSDDAGDSIGADKSGEKFVETSENDAAEEEENVDAECDRHDDIAVEEGEEDEAN